MNLDKENNFIDLVTISHDYLTKKQEYLEEKYGLSKYEKWFYDQEKGLLTFSDGDIVKLEILYESVGTISKISGTWLWAWANPHTLEKVKSEIGLVKEYGEKNNINQLTDRKWDADEIDGWEMTAISAYLMNAEGAYKVPTEKTLSYMIFKEIRDLR